MDNTLQLLIDSFWPLFKAGLTISVPLMLVSFILGLVVAFAVALMRMSNFLVLCLGHPRYAADRTNLHHLFWPGLCGHHP